MPTSHRAAVEHVDIRNRDFGLDYVVGREPSHRRCAGGRECARIPAPRTVSLPGGTLAAALTAAAALLGGRRP